MILLINIENQLSIIFYKMKLWTSQFRNFKNKNLKLLKSDL